MYFATLNHPNGGVVPLMDEDEHGNEKVATFDTEVDAVIAITENMLGDVYGGRVYNTDDDGKDV
jgi:hypothetical protein